MSYLTESVGGDIKLYLHIQPRASKTRLMGLHDGRLKIGVSAPPVDGKANRELQNFLAKQLSVARSDIAVISGSQSRQKTILIQNSSCSDIQKTLEELLGQLA